MGLLTRVRPMTTAIDGDKQRRERARYYKARSHEARVEAEVRARMAEALGRAAQLDKDTRRILVGWLGRLGSNQDPEALNAARKVEETRQRTNLNWDDLIIAAAVEEAKAA